MQRPGALAQERSVDEQQFWATPERYQDASTREMLQIRLAGRRPLNYISFLAARFPHTIHVQAWDHSHSTWVTVLTHKITESIPVQFTARDRGRTHPQHYGRGHWVEVGGRILPVETERLRIILIRSSGDPPMTPEGKEAPYSLAVKRLETGYRIASKDDLPRFPSELHAREKPISSSVDLFGSRMLYLLHEEHAERLHEHRSWVCEPQPVGYAVVPLYVDMRTAAGEPQTLDRWYVDPTHPGPRVNLYYSLDHPSGPFRSSDSPPRSVQVQGTLDRSTSGIRFSSSDVSFVEVAGSCIHHNLASSWWVGAEVAPFFPESTSMRRTIVDLDGWRLAIEEGMCYFEAPTGERAEVEIAYPPGRTVRLVAAHLAEAQGSLNAGLHVWAETLAQERAHGHASLDAKPDFEHASVCRIGAATDGTLGIANFLMRGFTLKDEAISSERVAKFLADPESHVVRPTFAQQDEGNAENALLRMHPRFVHEQNRSAILGGPNTNYSQVTWKPVPRSYTLMKGHLRVPSVHARLWKFEFTNLIPEHYPAFTNMKRSVRLFPAHVVERYNHLKRKAGSPHTPGSSVERQYVDLERYQDAFRAMEGLGREDPPESQGISPTAAIYARDPDRQSALRSQSWVYGFQPWHTGIEAPRFVDEGQHRYAHVETLHRTNVGFFVGLRSLIPEREDFSSPENSPSYTEHFLSDDRIQSSDWGWRDRPEGGVVSKAGGGKIVGQVAYSSNSVVGVQFATQQTLPEQILPDDDFRDPVLRSYDWDNTASWHAVGSAYPTYLIDDRAVRVSRFSDEIPKFFRDATDLIVSPLISPVFARRDLLFGGGIEPLPTPAEYGGIASPLMKVEGSGRVYAAVRVRAEADLTEPLWLQVVNHEDEVLTERPMDIIGGEGWIEWWVGYTLQSIIRSPEKPSGLVNNLVKPVFAGGESAHIEESPDPLDDHVRVRLVQKEPTNDTWVLDTMSLFVEEILWEFSANGGETWHPAGDVRNNPNGVITFPRKGTALQWRATSFRRDREVVALKVRPWYDGYHTGTGMLPAPRGPNLDGEDQDLDIGRDPEFGWWVRPIPQWWFRAYRRDGIHLDYTRMRTVEDGAQFFEDHAQRGVFYLRSAEDTASVVDEVTHRQTFRSLVSPLPHAIIPTREDWIV